MTPLTELLVEVGVDEKAAVLLPFILIANLFIFMYNRSIDPRVDVAKKRDKPPPVEGGTRKRSKTMHERWQ